MHDLRRFHGRQFDFLLLAVDGADEFQFIVVTIARIDSQITLRSNNRVRID